MKIADSESIKAGEQELISSILTKLDPQTLSQLASKTLTPDDLEFVSGDMTISGNKIVYKMDFKATMSISVTFDRDGELVSDEDAPGDPVPEIQDADGKREEAEEPLAENDDNPFAEEYEADEPVPADEVGGGSMDDDMAAVFSKNRDFWTTKSRDALDGDEEGQTTRE